MGMSGLQCEGVRCIFLAVKFAFFVRMSNLHCGMSGLHCEKSGSHCGEVSLKSWLQ